MLVFFIKPTDRKISRKSKRQSKYWLIVSTGSHRKKLSASFDIRFFISFCSNAVGLLLRIIQVTYSLLKFFWHYVLDKAHNEFSHCSDVVDMYLLHTRWVISLHTMLLYSIIDIWHNLMRVIPHPTATFKCIIFH